MIKSIKIEKLFDLFDYDITFKNEENILIITGPNGFGKTKILNIIYSLFNGELLFFDDLVFERIVLILDNGISFLISKTLVAQEKMVEYQVFDNSNDLGIFHYIEDPENLQRGMMSARVVRMQTQTPITGLIEKPARTRLEEMREASRVKAESLIRSIREVRGNPMSLRVKEILDSIKVHFIKEQRLLVVLRDEFLDPKSIFDTIQKYAIDLKLLIIENLQNSAKTSQELDSSFPKRLLSEQETIDSEEFKKRFNSLKEKHHKLKVYGIFESEHEVPEYSERDARALLVYLKDSEKKNSVFDEIVDKLELFTSILNERRLTFKSIKIDKEKGFIFVTDKGKELKLTELSSGEQHEVVLLYELIFNTKENTVLLIDEPEISLHITWQKEFVKDLIKIIKLQKIQVIIATHAPSIINDRWDLVYSLPKPESV